MEFDQLRTFLAVVEHGSFGRAADALHVAQSTASFHIKALETHLGSRLLDRGAGPVRMTSSGRALKSYAARIMSLRAEAEARIGAVTDGEAGELTIAASTVPGEYLLPGALADFCAANPAVGITVRISDSRRATSAVLTGEADLAIVGSQPTDRRLECRAVADDEVVLVGPSPNPYVAGDSIEIDALSRLPLILREEGSGTRDAVADLVARSNSPDGERGPPRIRVGSTESARRCVLEGLGLAFLSRRAIAEDLAAGRVRVVQIDGLPIRRTFYGVWRSSATVATAAGKLLDVIAAQNGR
jgi:DNA-binding transcriptional LysR family regulator